MQIICPNCQKKYNINEAKLPPGVKKAKCKACAHLIPLKQAAAESPANPIHPLEAVCLYCGQSESLQPDKIPPAAKTIECTSCARPVPLSRRAALTAPVHPSIKESSAPAAEKAAAKPDQPPAGQNAPISFRCSGCGKKYKIDRHTLPPNVLALKCKACGYRVQLPREEAINTPDDPLQPVAQHAKPSDSQPHRVSREASRPAARPRKKKWRYAAAACVLLAGILAALVHVNLVEVSEWRQYLPGSVEKAAESTAAAGQLFAGGMNLSPSPGKVATRYANEANFITAVDADQLKTAIPQVVKDSLFPGQYWSREDKPQMTLNLDTIDLPNAALAEMTYEVKSIKSPGGKDLLRAEENNSSPRIQPGSLYPGNITLKVKQGTASDDLATAAIHFELSVPVDLEVFQFAATDQPGSVKQAAGIRATLDQLEKDVAQVSSSGGKPMRLIAYDQTGKALASRESMSTPSSVSTRFAGIISNLKVVVARKTLESAFEIEADLNQGKALALAREPEVPFRKRYNHQPVPTYVNFSADDLKNLTVEWAEGGQGSWNDSLSVKLPHGPFSGHAVWEVHFFGPDKPQFFSGSSAQGPQDISFTLNRGKLKQASAAFGQVQLSLHTDISRLVFAPQTGNQPAPQILPSGDVVSVEFDKNEITYDAGKADVIQTIAYDGRGKRLKQDQYTRNKNGQRAIYFWGRPAKFEMDISAKTIEKLIPFDIRQRPLDEKAYQAFKLSIENQRDVVRTIKAIDRARRKDRSYYGDDLAGLHYLYQNPQNRPMNLISQEIAHSDPAGQARFGYQVKPYKGYYFTVLSGVESNGVKIEYDRRSRESRFSWQKGTITTTPLTRRPDLAAIPADKSQPTYLLQWGQVFKKSLGDERLAYLPDGYYNKGWVEVRFIEK